MRTGLCCQCKVTPVETHTRRGTLPRCPSCLEANKRGRYDRLNAARKLRHHNKQGVRYPDKFVPQEQQCGYCDQPFTSQRKPNGKPVCDTCIPIAKEIRRTRNLKRVTTLYWKDPEAAKRKRLTMTLALGGISIEWYDAQPKVCGICGTTEPSKKGWCIDHDHSCCGYGVRKGCHKCVRGLLCTQCNSGLGMFKDNPTNLEKAIAWLKRGAGVDRPPGP